MNRRRRKKKLARAELELLFPGLRCVKYRLTSRATRRYNCLAWAVGENHRRWDDQSGHWPNSVSRDSTIVSLVKAYMTKGYDVCMADGTKYDPQYDKVVLYDREELNVHEGAHAAKLLANGQWSSKIGDLEDIEHPTPEDLSGYHYGVPIIYMRRQRKRPNERKAPRSAE